VNTLIRWTVRGLNALANGDNQKRYNTLQPCRPSGIGVLTIGCLVARISGCHSSYCPKYPFPVCRVTVLGGKITADLGGFSKRVCCWLRLRSASELLGALSVVEGHRLKEVIFF
ncbi:MAG: hypothetical protein AAFY26_27470, partial [Cyanobacteria bacterium J06638_22]